MIPLHSDSPGLSINPSVSRYLFTIIAHPSQINNLFFNISYPLKHRPNLSVYSEIFSLKDLIHRVDALVRVAQLNTIKRLLKEN